MLTLQRQEEILEILNKNKSATVEELSASLLVSGATIRRDLRIMEKQGLIIRSHGGAMPLKSSSEESAFSVREHENIAAKKIIASLALKLIKNGNSIFVNSSSTCSYLMPLLNDFSYLTVTTNSVKSATLLSQTNNVKIYLAGGIIENHSYTIVGSDTIDYISRIHTDLAILSTQGLDVKNGFTDSNIEKVKINQVMKKNSNKVAMLIDSTKFNKTFMCSDFSLYDIDYLITEKMPPKEYLELIAKTKCKLITPETYNNLKDLI